MGAGAKLVLRPTGSPTIVPVILTYIQHHVSGVQWDVQDSIVFGHVQKYTERRQKWVIYQKPWQQSGYIVPPVRLSEKTTIIPTRGVFMVM